MLSRTESSVSCSNGSNIRYEKFLLKRRNQVRLYKPKRSTAKGNTGKRITGFRKQEFLSLIIKTTFTQNDSYV